MLFSHRLVTFLVFIFIVLFYACSLVLFPDEPILRHSAWSEWNQSSQFSVNRTLEFQKIFVINLPSRTDRRDAMTLAAALTGLDLDWIDGVAGDQIEDKVFPEDTGGKDIKEGNKGSWRAHMNALRSVVEQGLGTALIVEDDIDWDVRLKSQLATFAEASRKFLDRSRRVASGALSNSDSTLETAQHKEEKQSSDQDPNPGQHIGQDLEFIPTSASNKVKKSAYGEGWDVLWLGHCGTDFPSPVTPEPDDHPPPSESNSTTTISPVRVVIPSDPTVPAPKHLKPHPFASLDPLGEEYPPHTRVVHASNGTVCTLAYAVSQQAARKLLWRFGLESFTTGWDLMLRDWCDGRYQTGRKEGPDARDPVCLTVQPPLFSHYFSGPGSSDIQGLGGGFARKPGTPYIRLSVRMNMAKLASGAAFGELEDQWGGEEES